MKVLLPVRTTIARTAVMAIHEVIEIMIEREAEIEAEIEEDVILVMRVIPGIGMTEANGSAVPRRQRLMKKCWRVVVMLKERRSLPLSNSSILEGIP